MEDVHVWTCLLPAVDVFLACDIEGIGAGMAGVWWTGIGPAALYAACRLKRIPRADWPEITEDVRYMGQVVAESRNERAATKSKHRR